MSMETYADGLAEGAVRAARLLRTVPSAVRDRVLRSVAAALVANEDDILAANAKDVEAAKQSGLSTAMVDRLTLTPARIAEMAQGVEEISQFRDPLGKTLDTTVRPNGLELERVTVPIGVVFFIYESRPNVTIDGAALCFKSGNAVILRGGKESLASSAALAGIVRGCLMAEGIDPNAVQLVTQPDRSIMGRLLQRDDALDLVIPRGGEGLIRAVVEQSRVPVIKHYKGICHVYVDKSADLDKAALILVNAKVQRPGVCNSMETVLIDRPLGAEKTRVLLNSLQSRGVKIHGCPTICEWVPDAVPVADESEYRTEFLALECNARVVDGVQEAAEHIEKFSSHHTDSVLAEERDVQAYFVAHVDSSSVMVNASTRFADGGQYGLGAEVGISTDKLHARGPMGVDSLTTYKWVVRGNGQVRP